LKSPNLPKVNLGFCKADLPAGEQRKLLNRFADRISFDWS
jgi:hypothetical protein